MRFLFTFYTFHILHDKNEMGFISNEPYMVFACGFVLSLFLFVYFAFYRLKFNFFFIFCLNK